MVSRGPVLEYIHCHVSQGWFQWPLVAFWDGEIIKQLVNVSVWVGQKVFTNPSTPMWSNPHAHNSYTREKYINIFIRKTVQGPQCSKILLRKIKRWKESMWVKFLYTFLYVKLSLCPQQNSFFHLVKIFPLFHWEPQALNTSLYRRRKGWAFCFQGPVPSAHKHSANLWKGQMFWVPLPIRAKEPMGSS